jgi:hypothetical protein
MSDLLPSIEMWVIAFDAIVTMAAIVALGLCNPDFNKAKGN